MTTNITEKRTNLIYGNCRVLSPDGHLMFRCLEKKARWYLDRNLGIIVDEDPLTVKLTFQPKGKGEPHQFLKGERENKCVVCGAEELLSLTRHHLVPYEYRQFFPEERKEHNSMLVVAICRSCHSEYESKFANVYKSQLASIYNAPINRFPKEKSVVVGALNTLRQHRQNLPKERIDVLKNKIEDYLISNNIEKEVDLEDIESIRNLYDFLKAEESDISIKHGKLVVERCEDLDSFELHWVEHFIKTMSPKFIPEYLKDIRGTVFRS